ncbi:hypothetical protein [Tabrizicola sp.]|uniref:hypothetical protein n=1 Tax=Tabrizicola sp. TaxID=2005166 RepID=UPI003F2A154A
MSDIQIKVILDAAHQDEIEAYCRSLTEMGLRVDVAIPEIGVIFGTGSPALLQRMQAVTGVAEAVVEGKVRAIETD